jgi:hypothetical protein
VLLLAYERARVRHCGYRSTHIATVPHVDTAAAPGLGDRPERPLHLHSIFGQPVNSGLPELPRLKVVSDALTKTWRTASLTAVQATANSNDEAGEFNQLEADLNHVIWRR